MEHSADKEPTIGRGTSVDQMFEGRKRSANSSGDTEAIDAVNSMYKLLKKAERGGGKKLATKDFAGVLAQLGSEMTSPMVGIEEMDKETRNSRELFMLAGDKIFGEESALHPSDLPDQMYSKADQANKLGMKRVGDFLEGMRELNLASIMRKPDGGQRIAELQNGLMSALWGSGGEEGDIKKYNGEIDGVEYSQQDDSLTERKDEFLGELMQFAYSLEKLQKQFEINRQMAEARERQQKIEEQVSEARSRDSKETEKVREKILLDAIVKEGPVEMVMAFPSNLEFSNGRKLPHDGFQIISDFDSPYLSHTVLTKGGVGSNGPGRVNSELNSKLYPFTGPNSYDRRKDLSINESVIVSPVEEDVEEEVVESVKESGLRGFMGKTREFKKVVKTGEKRHLDHASLVKGGKSEPAYSFRYLAEDTSEQRFFKAPGGRFGQQVLVECILPKSVIDKLISKLAEDPTFARKVVEELMLKRVGLPNDAWVTDDGRWTGGRPPYESWAESMGGKSKMYVNLLETSKDVRDKTGKIVEVGA